MTALEKKTDRRETAKRSVGELFTLALRNGVTPAGVVAIFVAIVSFSGDFKKDVASDVETALEPSITRNCNVTADLANVTSSIVIVDNDVTRSQRDLLIDNLKDIDKAC